MKIPKAIWVMQGSNVPVSAFYAGSFKVRTAVSCFASLPKAKSQGHCRMWKLVGLA